MTLGSANIAFGGRALVIEQSLTSPLPETWEGAVSSRSSHQLGQLNTVSIIEYSIDPASAHAFVSDLAKSLKPRHYYAHIVSADVMVVVYPQCVFYFSANQAQAIERCRRFGQMLDIPAAQLQFEKMFVADHPDETT